MNFRDLMEIVATNFEGVSTLENPDFRLEQAEYKKDEKLWDLVISYLVENTNKRKAELMSFTPQYQYHRMYKRVKINDNKEIVGFYMYNESE